MANDRPHVLLISTDHWAASLLGEANHSAILTPTLDSLARSGTRFSNAYSECPVCIPARRTLMTGTSPRTHGDRVFKTTAPMPELPTVAQTFRDAGYQAYAVGKLHVFPQRDRIGFDDVLLDEEGRPHLGAVDDYDLFLADQGHAGMGFAHGMSNNEYSFRPWHLPEDCHPTTWAARQMGRMIKRRNPAKPGFWYLSFRHPHPPLVPLQSYLDLYRDIDIDAPHCGSWSRDFDNLPYALRVIQGANTHLKGSEILRIRRAFYALCTQIDHQLRVIIGTLREEGLLDNTIICFTADHGDMLGNHGLWAKRLYYEQSANVPMILLGGRDGRVPHHTVDDRLVGWQDVMPTLLDLAGIDIPDTVEGLSMVGEERRSYLYGECGEGTNATRMIRAGRHKLIYYPVGNRVQLFDLASDPSELNDLASSPDHAAIQAQLSEHLVGELYGSDETWIEDGQLVGLPDQQWSPPSQPQPFRSTWPALSRAAPDRCRQSRWSTVKPRNFLFILSDQHHRLASGCYGHPLVQTPHLDALAARGTRFQNAYTNCPICVPARASLATGRYVHQIGYWDNGHPYDGTPTSWHQHLREQGFCCDSIGKLHFKGQGADHGFSEEIEPLHVVDGVGDVLGCIRDQPPLRDKHGELGRAGAGDSTYLQYDARCTEHALRWLAEHRDDAKPWAVFLNFVCPHPPYIAPPEIYAQYPLADVPLPPQWTPDTWPDHPAMDYFRRFFHFDQGHSEETVRRVTAAYYGTTTYLDQQIGRVLGALDEFGLTESTRVLYTSDHGECLGARGIFGKFTLYDEAAAVPMIMAGPDVPEGQVVQTPVSLVDCFPTALECVGAALSDEDLPGRSLWQIAQEDDQERTVFSEYHALGTEHGTYMLRRNRYKYNYYVGAPPQLFDLAEDPDELNDLSGIPEYQDLLRDCERELRALLDPEAVDEQAHASQRATIEAAGGTAAVIQRGAFDHSPTPGEKAAFRPHK